MPKAKRSGGPSSSPIILPTWALVWLIASSLLTSFDAAFVLSRPASFPKGSLHWLFFPYDLYVRYDPVYADLTDAFVIAQSVLNLIEIALIVGSLLMMRVYPSSSLPQLTILIASSATLFKTVLYYCYDAVDPTPHAGAYRLFNPWSWDAGYVAVFIAPSSLWIVFPLAVLLSLGGQFTALADGKKKATKKA